MRLLVYENPHLENQTRGWGCLVESLSDPSARVFEVFLIANNHQPVSFLVAQHQRQYKKEIRFG